MSTQPGKLRVGWSASKPEREASLENKQGRALHQIDAPPQRDVFWRLGELHTDILSTAEVVKQVQTEVVHLRQENENLRKKLSLVGTSAVEIEEPGLRSATGFVSAFNGRNSDKPRAPAVAPPVMELPLPEMVLPFSPEEDTNEVDTKPAGHKVGAMKTESAQPLRVSAQSGIASATVGWEAPWENLDKDRFKWNNTKSRTLSKVMARFSRSGSQEGTMSTTRASQVHEKSIPARAMVFDPDLVKEQLKKNIMKPDFNVARFYHTKGCAQCIARSPMFENISLAVISANTFWIAVDTEHNKADVLLDADPVFQIIEHMFCTFFFFEIVIRFAAFKRKRNCMRSGWFIFDVSLVTTMVIEDWVMTLFLLISGAGSGGTGNSVSVIKNTAILRILRLLRLARLGRCLKLMRRSPEVMIMVKAMAGSLRCVLWTCVLLAAMMFGFGVSFTQLCKETGLEEIYFPSLTGSLHTLMVAGLFPDLETISKDINSESLFFWLLFILYLIVTSICVLNLLIGVLVEVVKSSSLIERDAMDVAYVKQVFVETLDLSDMEDITHVDVSKEELLRLLQAPEILDALTRVGIDVFGLVDLMDFIFIKGAVGVPDLLETVLQLRSSADVTVKDVVEVRKFLTYEINILKVELKQIKQNQVKVLEVVEKS